MAVSALNIICIVLGVSTLCYSLIKATHERKYWRVREGYYVHLTFEVVLYFITGTFVIAYNIFYILRDYFEANKVNEAARQRLVNVAHPPLMPIRSSVHPESTC